MLYLHLCVISINESLCLNISYKILLDYLNKTEQMKEHLCSVSLATHTCMSTYYYLMSYCITGVGGVGLGGGGGIGLPCKRQNIQ